MSISSTHASVWEVSSYVCCLIWTHGDRCISHRARGRHRGEGQCEKQIAVDVVVVFSYLLPCVHICATQQEPLDQLRVSLPLMPQDGKSAILFAAKGGHTETAALLIERGADIQAKSKVRSNSLFLFLCFVFIVVCFKYNLSSHFSF